MTTKSNKATKKVVKSTKKETVKFDSSVFDKELDKMKTKSAKIRFLLSKNWSRSQIASKLGIIYQHVRNVEITPIKKQK